MGQNNSANNQHGYALTPLAEPIFTIPSARIPLRNKNLGRFEAALIERMDPVLARYPSAYGFDFASQPGLARRLKNELTLRVPVPLRGPLRQIQQRYLSREEWPFYLRGDYFERIFGDRPLEMSRYIDVEGIRNVGLLKRVLAIELLLTDRF
jgi:asparagine synthase (glutamine-hydrolysing)